LNKLNRYRKKYNPFVWSCCFYYYINFKYIIIIYLTPYQLLPYPATEAPNLFPYVSSLFLMFPETFHTAFTFLWQRKLGTGLSMSA
jgi:hypothetical protein